MKFVDFNSIGVRSKMEADGNELDKDLLNEVQCHAHKDGDDDFVHDRLPVLGRFVAVDVVVFHGGEERNFDRQPPEEQRRRKLQLLAHVPPLFAIVREQTGDESNGPRQTFCDQPASPEGQPYDLKPDGEPEQCHTTDVGILEHQGAQKERDEEDQDQWGDVGDIADQEAGIVDLFEEFGKARRRTLGRFV